MYALNINSSDKRILSATFEKYAIPGMPIVETLPDGNLLDYRYVDSEYVYDPIPVPDSYELASRRYNVGELIEGQGEIFEVISIIPAGAKLIPGSNIRAITLEEYIDKKIKEVAT